MCLVFLASDSGIKSGSVPRQLATCGSSADYFCTRGAASLRRNSNQGIFAVLRAHQLPL